jgi:manganese efflux pump family protein
MGWMSLLAIAVALAMDAFAVAIATGLALDPWTKRQLFRLAFSFGFFQAVMPVIGWAGGQAVHGYISAFDHWVAFSLLAFVGGRMVWGALYRNEEMPASGDPTSGWLLLMLSVATSIDALAVGLSLAMVGSGILVPALVIGLVAAAFTATGMMLGGRIGSLWGPRVEIAGGVILFLIGVRIVMEHMLG